MARLWSCGFELQSVTSGVEWDTTTGSPTINTATKRSGAAALRCNPSAATAYITHQYASSGTADYYFRFYVRIASAPAGLTTIAAMLAGSTSVYTVRLNSNRTLELWNRSAQLGSDSPALNLDQWYRIEIFADGTSGDATSATAYIDGTSFASGNGVLGDPQPNNLRVGVVDSATCDLYFDDIAINDNSGSSQNGLPGSGQIVHLKPNAAGDNNAWLKSGGGAGTTTNYQDVDEIAPDDATTYLKRTSGIPIDDYNVESSSTAGIGASDTITLVQVGARVGATSATASIARELTYRIKGQASGTVQSQADIFCNTTSFVTHRVTSPKVYQLTAYTNPQTSTAWTPATLDTMQIGVTPDVSSSIEVRVSTMWALVEYAPPEGTNVTVSGGVQSATFSLPTPVITAIQNVVIAAGVIAAALSLPAPSVVAQINASVSADVQSAAFALPPPTVSTTQGATITGDVVSASLSLPTPTISTTGSVQVTGDVTAGAFSLPSPTAIAAQNVSVTGGVVSATFSQPSPSVVASQVVSVSGQVVSATFSLPAPTIDAVQNTNPLGVILSATFSVNEATIVAARSVSVAADIPSGAFSLPAADVVTGITANGDVASASFNLPSPGIVTTRNTVVTADIQSAAFDNPAPLISVGVTTQGGVVSGTLLVLSPEVITTKSVAIVGHVNTATFSVQAPNISTGASVSAVAQNASFSLPAPNVAVSSTIGANALTGTFSLPTPFIGIGITVPADAVNGTFGLPAPKMPRRYPYHAIASPYSKASSPFTKRASPYTPRESPYSSQSNPYNNLP